MAVNSPVPPTIKFKPAEWRWATWRKYTPQPREVLPFEPQSAIVRLSKLHSAYQIAGQNLRIAPTINRSEARFWLEVMSYSATGSWPTTTELVEHLTKEVATKFDSPISAADILTQLDKLNAWRCPPELVIPLANLLPVTEVIQVIQRLIKANQAHPMVVNALTINLGRGYQDYVVPYLTDDERAAIRNAIRDDVVSAAVPTLATGNLIDFQWLVAAVIGGFSAELAALIAALPFGGFSGPSSVYRMSAYHVKFFIDLIFGLNDPDAVEREMLRLNLAPLLPHHAVAWIAHTETKALDWISNAILKHDKDVALPLFNVLARVEDEAVIAPMFSLKQAGPMTMKAVEWLANHPDLGARGAASLFAHGGANSMEARAYLRVLNNKGFAEMLAALPLAEEAKARFDSEVLNYIEKSLPVITDEDTPGWLVEALASLKNQKRAKLPVWLDASELPPLIWHGQALNRKQIETLLIALTKSTLEAPQPLVNAIKKHIEVTSRDAFGWAIFELWLNRGATSKDRWALIAVGLLGGDSSVMKLTPLIRKWPGEAQHQRAALGLRCLRTIGTDTALTQINNIGQKLQFKALKAAAQQAIQEIATERGISSEELADRIVPDCGLDPDGRRTFNYGRRQFTLVVNSELKPMIRVEDGKLKPDLPKPISTDDPELAAIAQAEWKLIKKQVRDVGKLQGLRLESAMMSRRTWKPDEFKTLLVDHPLMIHLVKSLIWGYLDERRHLLQTFRVTDEKDFADVNDESIKPDAALIGLVHPLQITPAEISAWGQVLSDYDRMPPFAQLNRKTYSLEPPEVDATEITRYKDVKIEALMLVGVLQKLGWQRGVPGDGGVYYEHSKPFVDDNITAIIRYQGLPIGYLQGWDDQSVEACFFIPGIYRADKMWPDHKKRLKLGQIDPVVMSEVLRDLALLSHKGGN